MSNFFSEEGYEEMIQGLFRRFPSFQKTGAGAYKPGTASMELADRLMGCPHRNYDIIHVAGTNGKGSVSNMLSSVLAASGMKVGLYTSPHIIDFRERMRTVSETAPGRDAASRLVPKEYVWDFMQRWGELFDHLDMSFFEITTLLALNWFAEEKADVVVLETGLGGRLDSTNIVTPVLSVITNIGLDHCDLLGDTLPEIAFEKAGIIKPQVPVVVGESHPETDAVFERKVLYTNLSEPVFMGDRGRIMSLITFADKVMPSLWGRHEELLDKMDLRGEYQRKNLRTVMAALDVLTRGGTAAGRILTQGSRVEDAIMNTASRTGFHGRWEKLSDDPLTICDIGHNEHGLRYNFAQLRRMKETGGCTDLVIVYGSVADKDVGAVMGLMPEDAVYVFAQASGRRALPAETVRDRYLAFCRETGRQAGEIYCCTDVEAAVRTAYEVAAALKSSAEDSRPLIYIGGSTYVVSEAVTALGYKISGLLGNTGEKD